MPADVVLASSGEAGEAAFAQRVVPGSTGSGGNGPVPMAVIFPRAILLDDAIAPLSGPFAAQPELPHPYFTSRRPKGESDLLVLRATGEAEGVASGPEGPDATRE